VTPDGHPGDAFLKEVAHELDHRFEICHATIQIELAPGSCNLRCDHAA
jgi:cobalt-zinc-cadmium efflux system protein